MNEIPEPEPIHEQYKSPTEYSTDRRTSSPFLTLVLIGELVIILLGTANFLFPNWILEVTRCQCCPLGSQSLPPSLSARAEQMKHHRRVPPTPAVLRNHQSPVMFRTMPFTQWKRELQTYSRTQSEMDLYLASVYGISPEGIGSTSAPAHLDPIHFSLPAAMPSDMCPDGRIVTSRSVAMPVNSHASK